ncbi:MAG: hypothetical protein MJZ29_12615 [Bacteroidaceae bacterium]|nr:hypothetical protein [Bacteroidaceae bacterium]
MKRIEGSAGVALIECVNPVRDKWRIRWDVQQQENGNVNYMEVEFNHKPTDEEIRDTIVSGINQQTDQAILSGFTYKGHMVWLSSENQFNYKAAYDLALQTQGATLPVTFKFGTDDDPNYYQFETLEEFTDFYMQVLTFIQMTLANGWQKKDAFSIEAYHLDG